MFTGDQLNHSCVSADLSLGRRRILWRAGPADGRRALDRERHRRGKLRGLHIVACQLSKRPDIVSRSLGTFAKRNACASGADAVTRKGPRAGLAEDNDRERQYQQYKS